MNIARAKILPLPLIVEALGGRLARKGPHGELWYHSPFRPSENTASFKVDTVKNRWHDFGHASAASGAGGGDVLDLWCDYHRLDRRTGIKEALRGLQAFDSQAPQVKVAALKATAAANSADMMRPTVPRFTMVRRSHCITHPGLKAELLRRRISMALASRYLEQVTLKDNQQPLRQLTGFGFANSKDGLEISIPNPKRNASFKTSIAPKTFSVIEGSDTARALVFEGFWDFLSYLELHKMEEPDGLAYVFNSVSFWFDACQALKAQTRLDIIHLFLDNDQAGNQATDNVLLEITGQESIVICMRQTYSAFKDLNAFWVA